MTDRYPRVYRMLRDMGHSPQAALLVLADAGRGQKHAMRWIRFMRGVNGGVPPAG